MLTKEKLRIFVAMPFSDGKLGANAKWKNSQEIETEFYDKVGSELSVRLGKEVEVVTERKKDLSRPITTSMFKEAMYADIYIADLTGENANVFLELGVRWGLRDNITILTAQDVSQLPFNVRTSSVIQYEAMPIALKQAVEDVIKQILAGIKDASHCDSPVRLSMDVIQMTRADKESLEKRIADLEKSRGADFMTAAKRAKTVEEKIALLNEAIRANPMNIEARIELGVVQRKSGEHNDESVATLTEALRLAPDNARIYQELGILYGKMSDFEKNVEYLRHAERWAPNDPEILRNLGGALRKLALRKIFEDPDKIDWEKLEEAKQKLDRSIELDPDNTYGLLNSAKLFLLFAKQKPGIKNGFEKNVRICQRLSQNVLEDSPKDYWAMFDLADTYILQGNLDEAMTHYQKAIDLIPPDTLKSEIAAPIRVLKELRVLGVDPPEVQAVIEKVLEKYEPLTA